MKQLLPLVLAALVTFVGASVSQGATRITTASGGNWNATSSWSGGVVPASTDNAVILAGASVTVTANATANSIIFSNNAAGTATLTVNSGVTLTVTSGITNQNGGNLNTSVLLQGAGTINCASLTVGGTTTPSVTSSDYITTLTSTVSNLSVSGSLSVQALYNSSLSAANQGVFALSSGTVTVSGGIVFGTVPLFGPTLTLAAGSQNGTLTLSGSTPFTITGGGSSTFTANGTNATVIYSGTAQTVQAATYQNLVLSGSGTKTTTGITVNGTLSMQGTATASAAPTYGTNSTLEYKGSAAQTSGSELAASLASLTINNVNGVTVASSPTISNTLTLASGKLNTGAYQINLGTNGSISGGSAASYVNGNLQKAFGAGTKTFTFAIGDASAYAPLTLSNLTVTTAGSLKANTTSGSHPQFGTSGLDSNRNVNRYWTLTQSGGAFGTYNATFGYPATDVDTNATPVQFLARQWSGGTWSTTTVSGTPSSTSMSINAQSGFGDFVIGNTSPWYNGAWLYRMAITIDHTKVAGPLTNFPVLISLTNSALQQYAQASGNDLLFTSNDGTTKLAHEIESYTSSNGSLVAWVNVPLLSAASDTMLYLYYGNSSATNQQSVAATWNSSFKGVWHFNNVFSDSTSNNYTGVNTGTINTAGKISNGRGFVRSNGVDYITVTGLMGSPSNLTLSVWINLNSLDTGGAEFISLGDYAAVRQDNTGILGYFYDGSAWDTTFSYTNAVGTGWRYVVYSRDAVGKTQKLYVDGVQIASSAFTNSISYAGSGVNTLIGKHGNGQTGFSFDGTMDEVRVSQTARSSAWVSTEYNNQNSPGSFRSVGITENVQPTKLAVTSVNGGSSPSVGAAFNVVVQAQDDGGTPQNVRSNTTISLSLNTGTGALGGTLTGTISAGTNSVTISGVTYTKAESGVSLTATQTSGDNLTAGNSSSFTVIPGNQTITFPSPGNQTYGVGPITLGATASSGLLVSYSVTSGPATVSSNVLTITGAGSVTIQASQSGNANWNAATPVNQTISIAQKTITGAITANNKTYDATTAATIASRTLSGVTNSDVVSLTGGTATFADKNVGNGKTVTATGLSLTGANAGNYVLASTSATNTASITRATLTVSATGVNKIYDGTTNATVTLSDNRLAGDVLTTSYTTASFADKNVGNGKTVTVSGIAISGTDSGNYTANTTASTTANITKAVATVTLGNLSQTYNGTAEAATASTTPTGLTVNLTYNGSANAPTNAGSYMVIGTINDANYQGGATNTLVIAKATGTVNLGNLNQTYNGSTEVATASTTPTGLTVNLTYNGSVNAPTNAGSYMVIGTINDANYAGSTTNTLVISKAAASVTLDNLNQTYNGSARAATASTTPPGLTVNLTYNGLANAPTNTGSYTVIGTINDANYHGSATNTLVIAKATGTVNLGDLSQTYNGSAETATATTMPTGLTVNLTYNDSTNAPTNAGSYTVIGTINDANYTGSATNTLVIAQASSAITFGSLNQTYDGSAKAATATTTPSGLAVSFTYNGSATVPTSAGSYTVVGTINDANYQGSATNTLVVDAATLTYTANAASMTYGAAVPGLNGSVSGFMGTDNQGNATTGTLTFTSAATSSSGVGSYAINGSGLTANNGNYTFVQAAGNAAALTINALPVNLTGTRSYDGTTTAAAGILSVANKVGSDNVTLAAGSGTLAGANVGSEAITSFETLALGGTAAGNYTLAGASGSVNITVSALALTVTNLPALDKVYDGSTNATLDATNAGLAGVLDGDDVTLVSSNAVAYFADKNVGTDKPVTVTGLALGGAAAANYTLADPTNVTANVTAAGLTVSGLTAVSKVYDATTNAELNGPAILNGVVSGDDVSLATDGMSAAFAGPNVGPGILVTVSGYAITGADAGNYTLTQPSDLAADITAAPLTITATANTKIYDGTTDASATPTINGLQGSDTVTGLAETYDTPDAGTGKTLSVSAYTVNDGNGGNNYTVSTVTSTAGVIDKASSLISFGGLSQTYDGAAQSATATTTPTGLTVDLTYDGSANAPTNAGSYTVIGTINDANYQGRATNTLVIAKAGATVTLDNLNQTYNGSAEAVTASTTPAGLTVDLTYDGSANAPTNAGSYTVIGMINDINYQGSATNTLVIGKAAVTISSGLSANDKNYDGTTTATLSSNNVVLSGVAAGDTADAILSTNGYTATFAGATVGTSNTVTVSGLTLTGSAATNYTLIQPDLTASITAAPLTVTANDTNRVYGAANPAFTFSYNGFVAGEDAGVVSGAPLLTTTATTNSSVPGGPYPITISPDILSATNYSFNLVNGNLTVTPALLTVIADNKSRAYGTTNPVLTASYNGFVNDENTNQLSGSPTLSTDANINSTVGVYPIQAALGTLTNANYAFNFANGTLTIIEVPPVLTISLAAGTAGQTNYVDLHCAGLTPGSTYYIDASTNLPAEWLPIVTLQAAQDGTITFTDTNAVQYPTRFYRLSGN